MIINISDLLNNSEPPFFPELHSLLYVCVHMSLRTHNYTWAPPWCGWGSPSIVFTYVAQSIKRVSSPRSDRDPVSGLCEVVCVLYTCHVSYHNYDVCWCPCGSDCVPCTTPRKGGSSPQNGLALVWWSLLLNEQCEASASLCVIAMANCFSGHRMLKHALVISGFPAILSLLVLTTAAIKVRRTVLAKTHS